MNFEVGETLIYPHHGAVTITKVASRSVRGVDTTYLTLNVHTGDLQIQIPVDEVDLIGVRDVIDGAGVEDVYTVLRGPASDDASNWSRRFKANQEKMASGDVTRVAEVVRDLWRREHDNGVSAGEKRMLRKAQQILASELALALSKSDEDALVVLEGVLADSA